MANIHKHKCVDLTKIIMIPLENAGCTVSKLLINRLTETRFMVCIKLQHLNDNSYNRQIDNNIDATFS